MFIGSLEQTTRGRGNCTEAEDNHQGFFCVVLFRSASSNATESAEHSGARRVWGSQRAQQVGLFSWVLRQAVKTKSSPTASNVVTDGSFKLRAR